MLGPTAFSGVEREICLRQRIDSCTSSQVSYMPRLRNASHCSTGRITQKASAPIYEIRRFDPQLIGDFLDRREMRLMLVPLYAPEVVPRESDEIGELFLGHETLRAVCPNVLANMHERYCKHSSVPFVLSTCRSHHKLP